MHKLTHSELSAKRLSVGEAISAERSPIYGLLENVRSLYNVGSIFRTSDAILLSRLYLTGFTPYPPRPEISKTALGAVESVPWSYHRKPIDAIEEIKSKGIKFILLEQTRDGIPIWELPKDIFPVCVAVGNEIGGITKDVVDAADIAVEIPMKGVKHSLNVAVAYGIAVYRLYEMYLDDG
ncbi:MAG: TrmH family RNA methyltransferase [Bacteroidetes bacterium]|nr:TrmH family RNA methyltransferase [Bacteroidota bacterium]